jgi:heterodisulfide reductase subunit B
LPQLVALALGVDPAALGLKRHVISPGPILQARELAQMHVA